MTRIRAHKGSLWHIYLFYMDSVDEIKQKLDIVDVVGEYVQLKKAGANFKGRCPFHNEKTPSFFVTPDRQIFHCFGCSEGGDMFTFLQKIEGIEFPEALRILAQKAGVQLQQFDPRATSQKNRLQDVCAEAAKFWQTILTSPAGKKASDYIKGRKIKTDTAEQFKLGYAPDSWDDTSKHLREKGYNETEIFQAGLTIRREKSTGYYDRFRDRLVFPIQDLHGNIVGFTGRTLKSDEQAKYINTPESPIYHKGRILYGLDKAKQAIRKIGYGVVVEGNMDAMTAHEAGYANVVACSGTALSQEQVILLKRYSDNVALCFDQDEAGQTAAKRSIDLLFSNEMNVKIIELVSGKDPDECIKNNIKDWEQSLRGAKTAMQFFFDRNLTPENLANIGKKKIAAKNVLTEIAKLPNKIEKDYWIKKLAEILSVADSILWESLPGIKSGREELQSKKSEPITSAKPIKTQELQFLERIMTILLNYPKLISYAEEHLAADVICNEDWRAFYKALIILYNENNQQLPKEKIFKWLEGGEQKLDRIYLNSLMILIDQEYEGFSADEIKKEIITLINSFKMHSLEDRMQELNQKLMQAEKAGQREVIDECIRQLQLYSDQLVKLK